MAIQVHSLSFPQLIYVYLVAALESFLDKGVKNVEILVRSGPLQMPQTYLVVKVANCVLHPRVPLQKDTRGYGLHKENFIRFAAKLYHHGSVVKLTSCVCSCEATSTCVAAEQKYVISICYIKKLLLRDLFLSPELLSHGSR